MAEALFVVGIISVLAAIVAWFLTIRIQRHGIDRIQAQQQAWERAQEVRQQQWRVQQEKRSNDVERNVTTGVQQLHTEWQSWQTQETERSEQRMRQFEAATAQARLEFELARLPRVEDTPMSLDEAHQGRRPEPHLQMPSFQGADLSGRDLSSRYLGHADLREARLVNAKLFMADLAWASLAGADLSGADLSTAHLVHADLRGACLVGANLLLADLNNAVLIGANLQKARNLTPEQIRSAIIDSSTQLDLEVDITLPRLPQIHATDRASAAPLLNGQATLPSITTPSSQEAFEKAEEAAPPLPSIMPLPAQQTQGPGHSTALTPPSVNGSGLAILHPAGGWAKVAKGKNHSRM